MALRNGSSGTLELPELTDIVRAFELQNRITVSLRASVQMTAGVAEMWWTASADGVAPGATEVSCLASVSVSSTAMRLRTVEAVLLHLLYALDFRLALDEWGEAEKRQ